MNPLSKQALEDAFQRREKRHIQLHPLSDSKTMKWMIEVDGVLCFIMIERGLPAAGECWVLKKYTDEGLKICDTALDAGELVENAAWGVYDYI